MRQAGEEIGEEDEAREGSSDSLGDDADILRELWPVRSVRLFFQCGQIPVFEGSQVLVEEVKFYSGGFVGGAEGKWRDDPVRSGQDNR